MANIGVNVIEFEGTASPAIVGAPVSVGAFLVQTQRGVANQPVRVNSYAEFADRFGGYISNALGAYLVKGFFDNGGRTAYISRVMSTDTATGHAAALVDLPDRVTPTAANTVRIEAGYLGTTDRGSWGNDVFVAVRPSSSARSPLFETARASVKSAAALPAQTNLAGAPTLTVIVDGVDVAITFAPADFPNITQATPAQIRDAVNAKTNRLEASLSATNELVLTSTGVGAGQSPTSIRVPTAYAQLNLAANATPVRGTFATPTLRTARLANSSGVVVGDVVRVADSSNATRVGFVKLVRVTPSTNEIEWATDIAGLPTWELATTSVETVTFDLTVSRGGVEDDKIVETWPGLSRETDVPHSVTRRLNDPLTGSRYVRASLIPANASPVGVNAPGTLPLTRLAGGRDGTATVGDYIGDAAMHTGINAFDAFDVQLVTCERTDRTITKAGTDYCEKRGDCMYVGAVPEFLVGAGQAVAFGQSLQGGKVYGALYGPWIQVFDPLAVGASLPVKKIPPVGHVMGAYARIEATRGIWKAPAGDEARLAGALDVEYRLTDAEHTNLVRNGSVNGIRVVPGAGIVVDASRTLSTDTRWLYVNVRLLFNYVKSSLKQGLRWTRQEPNKDNLWSAIKYATVTPFLMGLWRAGAFGTGTPEQVFTVICDASNNPPSEVDQGNLHVDVLFYPSRPAETIIIRVGQQPSGASTSES